MSRPAPPPVRRKEKPVNTLKAILIEQGQKLQQKHALEQELLEDIKSYSKMRANIEREYAQSLQRMVAQFMQKFAPKTTETDEARTPFGLWRKMLEETDETAKSRLVISQSLIDNVAEDIKALKLARSQTLKKCTTLTEALHQEMQVSVQDLANCQKDYFEMRKEYIQTAEQAAEAREKLKKGSGKFFSSKAKLEKNASKLDEKKEICARKALTARNDYLLSLVAANAHQQRYYSTDLPELIAVQDGDIYAKFKDYLTEISKLEIDNCGKHLNTYTKLLDNVSNLQRLHAIDFFLKQNPVFTRCSPYEFQPFRDEIDQNLSDKFGAGLHLNKEARKWALRLTREQKLIDKVTKEWRALLPQQGVEQEEADSLATSQAIANVLEQLRHLEVLKVKAEARLELLRHAGVNVDEWILSAMQEQEAEENEENEGNNRELEEDDLEDDWDEDRDFNSPENDDDDSASLPSTYGLPPQKVVAIYSFQAAGDEELSITVNEELELIEKDIDGWMKGKNSLGQVGFFPESYVEIKPMGTLPRTPSDDAGTSLTSSVSQERVEIDSRSTNSLDRNIDYICLVRALYDYSALEDEELSFQEGDIIMVTNKNELVDDGWWEGTLNSRKGIFPNIVVEEIRAEPEDAPKEWPFYEGRRTLTDNNYASLPRSRSKTGSSQGSNTSEPQYRSHLAPNP